MMSFMRRLGLVPVVALMLALGSVAPAFAAANPSGTGQPNQSCEEQPSSPPGFETGGFANAQAHYAGSEGTPSAANAGSSHAVSQYDVACYQVSQ